MIAGDYQSTARRLIDGLPSWFLDGKRLEGSRMTNRLYPYAQLFSPVQVNSVKIKNLIYGLMCGRCSTKLANSSRSSQPRFR
jgi:hypothetical protein